ncbi:hypothetical protein ABZ858_07080 [Streptomyces sp. NPDC047017]|uniref:hypothetical protein n=1 Tax=Streptomyces sp. NPDC047017 TaxID=3155024 RepID=UPI0033EAA655
MLGRLRRAHREWRRRGERRRRLAALESWLIAAARKKVVDAMADAHGTASGRGFVAVADVLAQVRRDLRDQALLGAALSERGRRRGWDEVHERAGEDRQRAAELEIPAWTAAAAVRWQLDNRRDLPVDTDAYDRRYDRPAS